MYNVLIHQSSHHTQETSYSRFIHFDIMKFLDVIANGSESEIQN